MPNGTTQMTLQPNRGPLYIRSILKLTIVIFIATQFLTIHPFISLIVIAVAYFMMPTRYSEDEPWKMIEAWLRLYFAVIMAMLLWAVLSGKTALFAASALGPFAMLFAPFSPPYWMYIIADGIAGNPAVALFFLILAFFCTLPEHKKPVGEVKVEVDILGKAGRSISGFGISTAGNIIFLILAVIGGLPILFSWLTGAFQQIFTIIYILGLFMGWFARGEGRPYVGVLVVGIAILAFSFQYTGTVGMAIFGQWWPTVYHYGSMVAEPIGAAWSSAATSMQDLSLMMTCPSCYWAKQLQMQQVETGKVTTGGTTRSIELTNFEAINYMTATPQIDPSIPLVGSIELENRGEFTASWVNVKLDTPKIKNASEVSAADPTKGIEPLKNDACFFTSCTGTSTQTWGATGVAGGGLCKWDTESYPGDIKLMMFRCGTTTPYPPRNWSASGDGIYHIYQCECHDEDSGIKTEDIECESDCGTINSRPTLVGGCECYGPNGEKTKDIDCGDNCGEAIKVYKYGSWYLTIGFDYEFNYDANVSLPVEVMQQDIFEERLLNKEIRLESKESQYTGGPIMVSLWTQKQPLRSGEESYGRISFINKGQGTVSDAELTLYIPATIVSGISLTNPSYVSSSKLKEECKNFGSPLSSYKTVNCKLKGSLANEEYATLMFSFNYTIKDPNIDAKSLIFIGDVNYNYTTSKSMDFEIMKTPLAQ